MHISYDVYSLTAGLGREEVEYKFKILDEKYFILKQDITEHFKSKQQKYFI